MRWRLPCLAAALYLLLSSAAGRAVFPAPDPGDVQAQEAADVASPEHSAPPEGAPAPQARPQTQPEPPRGEVYINDRFGYALRRPRDWTFRFEPGIDVVLVPERGDAEIQVVARTFFDIRLQQVPEGPLTLDLRAAARGTADAFERLRHCLSPALREYVQLFWLDSYVAWHTDATAEEYSEFRLESRRALRLGGHGGVELIYTLEGKRRPGIQKIKTIIVAFDERICQLSYIASRGRYDDQLEEFHAVVNSLYLHRDRG